jgi:drug/metabolite transporter (DMT)-like permease
MLETWVLITVAAAFLQNVRSALQRTLTLPAGCRRAALSVTGAAYVRFAYALPFGGIWLAGLAVGAEHPMPEAHGRFFAFALTGGLAQILATIPLLESFDARNFVAGTAYSKTEALQTALLGFAILGETVSAFGAGGIVLSVAGVLLLSVPPRTVGGARPEWGGRALAYGVGAGLAFAVSAVCYRGAALSLGHGSPVMAAAYTLAWVLLFQTISMAAYLALREPGELSRVIGTWRPAVLVELAGMAASACWFTAMTLQNAAYVRALGQVELLFTFGVSVLVFGERVRPLEYGGTALLIAGIVLLLIR